MSKLSDRFSVKISEPSFVKLYEKSAAPISGYEVTESGWQLKVELRFPLLFKKTVWKVTRDLRLWQTQEQIPKTAIPIQSQWLETGFDVIDDLVLNVLEKVPGFTMKSAMVQTIDSNVTTPPVLKVEQLITEININEQAPNPEYFRLPKCKSVSDKQLKKKSKKVLWMLYGKLYE